MLKVLSYILCDLDPKVKVIGKKAGICDGVPSTSALVNIFVLSVFEWPLKTGVTVPVLSPHRKHHDLYVQPESEQVLIFYHHV